MNTPDLFAIADEINRAAETEIAANLLPRQTVAFVCDDDGSVTPGQKTIGPLRLTIDIQRYRENARTLVTGTRLKPTRLEFSVSFADRREGELPQLVHVRDKGRGHRGGV